MTSGRIRDRLRGMARAATRAAHLMAGLPDYEAYLAHMREHHPDRRPASRAEFVAECQKRRYGGGMSRCC